MYLVAKPIRTCDILETCIHTYKQADRHAYRMFLYVLGDFKPICSQDTLARQNIHIYIHTYVNTYMHACILAYVQPHIILDELTFIGAER